MTKALDILNERLSEDTLQMSYDKNDEFPVIRIVLDGIGADENGLAVLELSEIPVEEEENAGYYHFMTVMANNLEDAQIPSTLVNLNAINAEALIGSYQIVPGTGTVAHKYVLRLAEDNEEKAADGLYDCLVDVVAMVNNDYDRVLAAIG